MTFDDVEGFLKFLDNVSFQLACLLDIDGDHRAAYSNSKRSYTRPRLTNASLKSSSTNRNTKIKQNQDSSTNADRATSTMRQPLKSRRPATRARTRRKQNKSNDLICSNDFTIDDNEAHQNRRLIQLSHRSNHDQRNQDGLQNQGLEVHQLDHHSNPTHQHQHSTNGRLPHQPPVKQQHSQAINGNPDTHNLESQLALSIVDELVLGTPISPPTHLSPIEPSIQFSSIQQQHYYSAPRGHLDSYQMHDDFSGTEVMPISGTQHGHINQQQHHHHQQEQQQQQQGNTHQTHLVGHQTSVLRVNPLGESTLNTADCYTQPHPHTNQNHHHQIHQNEHQHHHHQHHQHLHHQTLHSHNLQQQHQHQPQYHQLDQQWVINSTTNTNDAGLQLGNAETSPLDHVVSMSPVATHQPLDHVQFNAPLYQHSYYNQQQEHLDSFQHINEDYTNNSATLGSSASSPLEHHHRMQQEQEQSQTQLQTQVRMHPLDMNSSSDNSNGYEHQHTQHHNHQVHHHNEHHLHTYQHQHSQHSSMVPLLNSIEPNGVIIQDINLAAASWSSPEDLYSI